MVVHLDVIVGRNRAALPFGVLIALARKPLQRRPVETGEEIVAALLQPFHHLCVDLSDAVTNGVVQFDQGEEAPVAQLTEHEARDNADRRLNFSLVTWAPDACWQNDEAVVIGEVLICPIDARLIARRLRNASLQIVGHSSLRHATEEIERVDVRADPVGQRLRPAGLSVGIARRPERRDEEMCLVHLTGHRIDDVDGIAGPVDEQLVAGHVRLPHGR